MATYRVDPPPLKTRVVLALSEACLPLVIESVIWPHRIGVNGLVGQGIICVVFFFFMQLQGPYDIEIDDSGIREVRKGQVDRAVSSDGIRYAKERGWWIYRGLKICENGPVFGWLHSGGLTIPASMPEYEEIKTRVLGWIEHPRAVPQVSLYR